MTLNQMHMQHVDKTSKTIKMNLKQLHAGLAATPHALQSDNAVSQHTPNCPDKHLQGIRVKNISNMRQKHHQFKSKAANTHNHTHTYTHTHIGAHTLARQKRERWGRARGGGQHNEWTLNMFEGAEAA